MRPAAYAGLVAGRVLRYVQRSTVPPTQPDTAPTSPRELSRWADYFAVAATPRFRASQRGRLRDSARHGMVLVIGTALFEGVWLSLFHRDAVVLLAGINAAIALVAALGYMWIGTRARRHPEGVVFAVLATVDVGTIALGVYHPALGLVAAGHLLLLPTIVALLIPWATRIHVWWLVVHSAATLVYSTVATEAALSGGTPDAKLTLLLMAIVVSQFGHVTALRARVLSFVQIDRIRALNRQARRDHSRLDRLNGILEQTARTDELTGLKNRSSLKRDLRAIRARIARHRESYGFLVLDLDRFKAINDELGHVVGDDVLRTIAGSLKDAMRADDSTYRYGGEEFVVLMQVREPHDALVAAERVRRIIEGLDIPHPGNPPHDRATLSVGVAVIGPDDLAADDDAWFARADVALFRAKEYGRNRCEIEIAPSASPSRGDG